MIAPMLKLKIKNQKKSGLRYVFSCVAFFFMVFVFSGCDRKTEINAVNVQEKENYTPCNIIEKQTPEKVFLRLGDGKSVAITKHPERTVVLLTSLLSLWYEVGGQAIARCNGKLSVPEAALPLPEVGTFNHPNVEKIIALKPDLVISSDLAAFRAMIPILEQNHIEYAYFNYINFHDYMELLDIFSAINGTKDRFDALSRNFYSRIDAVIEKCKNEPPPTVIVVFTTPNQVSCELPHTQTGVMLSMLGAKNIIPAHISDRSATRVNFSLEHIVQADPDIILLNTMGEVEECRERLEKEFASNQAWASLRAIREHRFYVLPKELFLYKANARFPEALAYLAAILYPEKFEKNP